MQYPLGAVDVPLPDFMTSASLLLMLCASDLDLKTATVSSHVEESHGDEEPTSWAPSLCYFESVEAGVLAVKLGRKVW